MRICVLVLFFAACTDAAEVPSTVVHIDASATCATPGCSIYGPNYYDSCGPMGSTAITEATREVEVTTSDDAADIAGYLQLQYTDGESGELVFTDQTMRGSETADVYSTYSYERLYTLSALGEVTNIDMTKLSEASGNTLQFKYGVDGFTAQEDHVIDAARPIRLETDDPGIMDACCSVGDARQAGFMLLVILFGLPRRRR